jgi:tetratricopeptide (TPR) repeat protein
MAADGYTVVRIDDVEPIPAINEPFQIRLLRRTLGIQAFGMNAYTAPAAGDRVIEEHDELGGGAARHEELYLVVSGKATFTVDGQTADVEPGGLVFVADAASRRGAIAAEPGTTVVVVGGTPGEVNRAGGWEQNVLANPAYMAGNYDEAIRILSEGLDDQPESAGVLYNLACFNALAGHGDEAIDLLNRAFTVDPSAREWATDDADLDSIRSRKDYPA